MKRALALVALTACAGAPRARPVMPVCAASTQPGVTSRALTWNGNGWGAVIADGATLYLREFGVEGASRGERVTLVDEPSTPPHVGVAWAAGAYYVAVAPHRGSTPARVFRVASGRADGEAFAIDEGVRGELAVVARGDVPSKPAGLFLEGDAGVTLRLVASDGEPGAPRRCPEGVRPRAVTAWRDGFRALVTSGEASGDGRTLDVVALDDECEVVWRRRVWDGAVSNHAYALAVDEGGVVVAFDARDDGTLIAAVDHAGAVRIRALRMERNAHEPQVFVQTDASGRRLGIQVVAVRSIETGDQLEVWRLTPDGLLRETRPIASSPDMQVRFGVADPWGGGLLGFTRAETSRGGVASCFFARVCP